MAPAAKPKDCGNPKQDKKCSASSCKYYAYTPETNGFCNPGPVNIIPNTDATTTQIDLAKVTLTMNLDQAYTLMNAMEFYARIHIGQFDQIDWEFTTAQDCNGKDRDFWRDQNNRDELHRLLNAARSIIFPELQSVGLHGSHGIYSKEVSPNAGNAWDIYQVIRRGLAMYRDPNPSGYSTSYNQPMSVSEKNPLPTATIKKDRRQCPRTPRSKEPKTSIVDVWLEGFENYKKRNNVEKQNDSTKE